MSDFSGERGFNDERGFWMCPTSMVKYVLDMSDFNGESGFWVCRTSIVKEVFGCVRLQW